MTNQPQDANPPEDIVEEEDLDLDLGDLQNEPEHRETIRERLQRAAKRRTTKQQEKNWHDTPINVTPSGRHEVIDEDLLDDIDLEDDDTGEVVVTPSGRQEVVDEDMDLGDLDESSLDANDYNYPGPATRIEQELDMSGVPESEPVEAGPMTMAAFDMENTDAPRKEASDTERVEAVPGSAEQDSGQSGPMTMAAMEMGDADQESRDDTETPSIELEGVSMGDSDDLGGSGPMTLASQEMESDIAQDAVAQGDKVAGEEQNPTGEISDSLIDNTPQQSDQDDNRAAASGESSHGQTPTAHEPQGESGLTETSDNQVLTRGDLSEEQKAESMSENEDELDLNAPEDGGEVNETESDELDLGGEQGEPEDSGNDEAVSEDSGSAEVSESYSQPEESTVGDDSGAPLGRGLDVGTANLVASRMDEEGGIEFFPARNAFLDVPEDPYTLKMLKGQGVPYIKRENKLFIIGEDAFELANIFNREMRRPMKNGLISPTDVDAMPMEVELFKKILGPPRSDGEMVYYSVPADPVDSTMNIVYHTNIVNGLLDRLGYRGTPFNEGQAIVFSELGDDDFTGIGISCGGGMVNVCVAFRSMPVVSFSTSKGGDWIDQQAAQVMGCAASKITAAKERGVDINAPKTPEEEAIVIYYRHLIKYSLDNIIKKFENTKDIPNFPKPVPIAVSGGTSKVGGFVEVFKDEFSKLASRFPIKVSDIRRAEDQLNATSKGCLLAALSHED